ncbi:MAG: hypothetical protein LRY56_06855 [Burkholderiaceae bacterium]|nr:hypothetical protein [Burkholderiaceae bacterium]MCD8537215.1 hypothetical protein [Burkholderiaceae bacterium]
MTIRTSLSKQQIAWRVHRDFQLDPGSDDFGMVMHDALRVDLVQSLRCYADLHKHWAAHVDSLAGHLKSRGITHLLADTPYLTLAAAQAANIPSAAICSLNWADILERCVRASPQALQAAEISSHALDAILTQMRDAYTSAAIVIRPEPAIETTGFETVTTEPLVEMPPEPNRTCLMEFVRSQIGDYLGDHDDCLIVLTSMGGIGLALHPAKWPTECLGRKVIYLTDPAVAGQCPHAVGFNLEKLGFSQMMTSCDAVLTKPGYGMFVESRACGKPMLYIARDDWPESACLETWAAMHTIARKLSLEQVVRGEFSHELAKLLESPKLNRQHFTGADTAAQVLSKQLFGL